MKCDRCGHALEIGDFPFCKGNASDHGKWNVNVIDDQLEGGPRRFDVLEGEPFIESKSQWKREIEARGLECIGDRKPRAFYEKRLRMHNERLKDTGATY